MTRRIIAAVAAGALVAVLGAMCAQGAPACKVGSVKGERGHIYHCEDNGNGPQWVRHVLVTTTVTVTP